MADIKHAEITIQVNAELERICLESKTIIEGFHKLLGVHTSTEALGKIAVLMREESEIETKLNKYKKFVDSIYEIVSVNCTDVGETFAGIQSDIEELRKETAWIAEAELCKHGKGHCQCDDRRCRNYCD